MSLTGSNTTSGFVFGAVVLALVAGCSGGAATTSNPGNGSVATQGAANVSFIDAPGEFTHAWITVTAVWFNTSDTAGPDDAGWVKYSLPSPQAVDVRSLTNGKLGKIFGSLSLSVGTYQQIRLILVGPEQALTISGSAQSLSYNDEVVYLDAANNPQTAPLEIVDPDRGVALHGSFTIAAGATLNLALDFNIYRDILRFNAGSEVDFILNPRLSYFDLAHVGAIQGSVNCKDLTNAGGTFAERLDFKAEAPNADGSYYVADRETSVFFYYPTGATNPSNCYFDLYPLHVPAAATSTNYDIVIRGSNMETMIVQNVPVTAGTTTVNATAVNATPINLIQAGEYTANITPTSALVPTGADVEFYQTLPGMTAPYEIRYQDVNPFTGTFIDPEALSLGPVQVGVYKAGGDPIFAAVTPSEGLGGFSVYASAPNFARTSPAVTLTSTGGAATTFTVGPLVPSAGVSADSISGTFTQTTAGKYDSGYLVVEHDGYIVTALALDAVLSQNAGGGGSYTIVNVPGGSSTQTLASALYYLHCLLWNSADPLNSLQRVVIATAVDLRGGGAANVNVTVN